MFSRRTSGFQKLVGVSLLVPMATGVPAKTFCLLQYQLPTIRGCGSSALFIVFFSFLKDLSGVFLFLFRQFASFPIGSFPAFPTTYYSHNCP